MKIKRLFIFLISIIAIKNLVLKENYEEKNIDDYIKENTPDLSKYGVDKQDELDPLDPDYAAKFNAQINSQVQKDLQNERAFTVTEDGAQVSGVRHNSKPTVDVTVGGKNQEKEGRGLNEVVIFIIIIIVVSRLIYKNL